MILGASCPTWDVCGARCCTAYKVKWLSVSSPGSECRIGFFFNIHSYLRAFFIASCPNYIMSHNREEPCLNIWARLSCITRGWSQPTPGCLLWSPTGRNLFGKLQHSYLLSVPRIWQDHLITASSSVQSHWFSWASQQSFNYSVYFPPVRLTPKKKVAWLWTGTEWGCLTERLLKYS